jgi:hypothetical protein
MRIALAAADLSAVQGAVVLANTAAFTVAAHIGATQLNGAILDLTLFPRMAA